MQGNRIKISSGWTGFELNGYADDADKADERGSIK